MLPPWPLTKKKRVKPCRASDITVSRTTAIRVVGLSVTEPGEAQMMLRHADGNRRRHQGARLLAGAAADHLGGERVGADQAGRPVLLGRADRDDDAGLGLEIVLDERPGLEL